MTIRQLALGLATLILAATLGSCGGGSGGGSSSSSSSSSASSSASAHVTATIAPSVPAIAAGKVAHMVTPLGTFAVGSAVDMPTLTGDDEAILMATDSNGNIVLASFLTAGTTGKALNATTTALTISRLMLGPLPTGTDTVTMNGAIQASAEFPHLVALIDAALAAGNLPQDYPGMGESLSLVISQATAKVAPKASGISMVSARLANPTVTTPFPYTVMSGGPLGVFNIKVTGANSDVRGANVSNGFPIQFAAYGTKADGTDALIPTGSTSPDGYVQLPSSELYKFGSPVPVPGTGQSWNLTVLQTPASRTANGSKMAVDLVKTAMSAASLGDLETPCVASVVVAGFGSETVAPWARAAGGEEGWNGFMDKMSGAGEWFEVGKKLYECGKQALPNLPTSAQNAVNQVVNRSDATGFTARVAPIFGSIAKLLKSFDKAQTVYEVASLGTESWALWNYWSFTKTVGICGRTDTTTQIGNCAAALTLTPGTASGLIGDTQAFTANAVDANGQPTLLPQNLEWSSSAPAVAKVDPNTGVVTALTRWAVPITITAKDPVTGATGSASYSVKNVSAAITVTPASINLGGSATLNWLSSNSTGCTASGAWSGTLAVSGSRTVSPGHVGTYDYNISCAGSGGPAISAASLVVASAPATGSKTLTYTGAEFTGVRSTGDQLVTGHIVVTIRFKEDMSTYDGAMQGPALVESMTMSVSGNDGRYTLTYLDPNVCLSGFYLLFDHGQVTYWTLGLSKGTCENYGLALTMSTVRNTSSGPTSRHDQMYDTSGPVGLSGHVYSTGLWVAGP